jgi:hypothetical protein
MQRRGKDRVIAIDGYLAAIPIPSGLDDRLADPLE